MRQYCRYCAFCVYGDCLYCSFHNKTLSETYATHTNTCNNFALSDMGDVITGRQYRPHRYHGKQIDGQMSLFDKETEDE